LGRLDGPHVPVVYDIDYPIRYTLKTPQFSGQAKPRFCAKCGQALSEIDHRAVRYDRFSGVALRIGDITLQCPSYDTDGPKQEPNGHDSLQYRP
jgi:hypothetical protein